MKSPDALEVERRGGQAVLPWAGTKNGRLRGAVRR